jgi:hypothetical protein
MLKDKFEIIYTKECIPDKICIYNDKKEKHNSFEALLNCSVEEGSSEISINLLVYGKDEIEVLQELDIEYNRLLQKFEQKYLKVKFE